MSLENHIDLTLQDGQVVNIEPGTSVEQAATRISKSIGKSCVAGYLDEKLVDASEPILKAAKLKIVTAQDPEGLEIIRHSCAHLFAHAVSQLWPDVKLAIGPTIEDGFYYDIEMEHTLLPADLLKVENHMRKLAKRNYPVVREVVSRETAQACFGELDQSYKLEIVNDIPDGQIIALYRHQEYTDMCRGPHVTNTKHLKHFKLTSLAGAYWRGDSDKPMLQRVYGTAFASQQDLDDHLTMIKEAKKRDHRLLGQQMDLFHLQPEGPGMVFWHPAGLNIYTELQQFVRKLLKKVGYEEILTPQILDLDLWKKSGHAAKFSENMFLTGSEDRQFAVKPMSCPGHVQVYKSNLRSYRDLPIKYSEFGVVHRNEASGTLHGLMRVRGLTQDDGHVFCTHEQIQEQTVELIELVQEIYTALGFDDFFVKLSTRPENYLGEIATWNEAEKALAEALTSKDMKYIINEGEGAFYGPKIEFVLRDSLKRHWQCGTIQLDFQVPELLDAKFVTADDNRQTPVMIHRALLGSLERFIGIMIEHTAGWLPLFVAPRQVAILPITSKHNERASEVQAQLEAQGFRVSSDLRNEKVGYKIREATLKKITYLLIIGDKELEDQTVTVRQKMDDLGSFSVEQVITALQEESKSLGASAPLKANSPTN